MTPCVLAAAPFNWQLDRLNVADIAWSDPNLNVQRTMRLLHFKVRDLVLHSRDGSCTACETRSTRLRVGNLPMVKSHSVYCARYSISGPDMYPQPRMSARLSLAAADVEYFGGAPVLSVGILGPNPVSLAVTAAGLWRGSYQQGERQEIVNKRPAPPQGRLHVAGSLF